MATKKTIFYNTSTNQIVGQIRDQYIVDGQTSEENPDILPQDFIELEVIFTDKPEITDTQIATMSWEVNVVEKTYIRVWNVREKTQYELDMEDWDFPMLIKRIKAPATYQFITEHINIKTWFDLNGLPIIKRDDFLYCYCNEILPEHQDLVNQLEGVIIIEDIPQE